MEKQEFDDLLEYIHSVSPPWAQNEAEMPLFYIDSKISLVLNRYNRINNEQFHLKYRKGKKLLLAKEILDEELKHFDVLRPKYCALFENRLRETIGPKKYDEYSFFLSEWQAGRKDSDMVKQFKKVTADYYIRVNKNKYCEERVDCNITIDFSEVDIVKVLELQIALLNDFEQDIKSQSEWDLDDPEPFSNLFRGLNLEIDSLKDIYSNKEFFIDKNIFSSYTNSLLIAELFSEINQSKTMDNDETNKILIVVPFSIIDRRVFGSALLNKEFELEQFEFLLTPSLTGNFPNYKGKFDGKFHYMLESNFDHYDGGFESELEDRLRRNFLITPTE